MSEPRSLSLTGARWRMREADEAAATELCEKLGTRDMIARALACRGITDVGEARSFLGHDIAGLADPFLMKDMDRAVERVEAALARGVLIRVYGDYDVDGVCATALLVRALQGLGGRVDWYIPHRLEEGYGVNEEAVQQASAEGVELLVAVDCGSTAVGPIALARRLGMEVVVCDHHRLAEELPDAPVLNPWRDDCAYPFKDLAGVGVTFKLVSALARARQLADGQELHFLDLVCLGTVADVVPLLGENRLFVQHGLQHLPNTRKLGLAALMEAASIRGPVLSGHVAFGLAPRINAVGRMEHACAAVKLLLTSEETEARALAADLSEQNTRRRAEERQTLAEAEEMLAAEVDLSREPVIVLASERWHPGVIGIVASRLVERYHRPALLVALSDGVGKGSGRSVEAFNLWEAVRTCAPLLTRFGGHHYAVGFGVMEEDISSFRERINELASARLAMEDLVRYIDIDAEIHLRSLTLEALDDLDRLAPFGMANPRPTLLTQGLVVQEAKCVGDGSHLALRVREEGGPALPAIWFGAGEFAPQLPIGRRVDACYRAKKDEWNGNLRVRLQVEDVGVREGS